MLKFNSYVIRMLFFCILRYVFHNRFTSLLGHLDIRKYKGVLK